jgi:hypothetical protein
LAAIQILIQAVTAFFNFQDWGNGMPNSIDIYTAIYECMGEVLNQDPLDTSKTPRQCNVGLTSTLWKKIKAVFQCVNGKLGVACQPASKDFDLETLIDDPLESLVAAIKAGYMAVLHPGALLSSMGVGFKTLSRSLSVRSPMPKGFKTLRHALKARKK